MLKTVVVKEKPDVLILQAGTMELNNIKVNEAMMDTTKDIEEHKKEWFKKAEEDSLELFKIAEEACKKKRDLKVLIIKRLPRFDRTSQDIIGIKSELSVFANTVLDQQWIKQGRPSNIKIVEMQLNVDRSDYLRDLIYGSRSSGDFDGIHLRGRGAVRHFSYRAAQLINQAVYPDRSHGGIKYLSENRSDWRRKNDDHRNCPQAKYARAQNKRYSQERKTFNKGSYSNNHGTYSDAVINGPTHRTFRGQNIYNHLNY